MIVLVRFAFDLFDGAFPFSTEAAVISRDVLLYPLLTLTRQVFALTHPIDPRLTCSNRSHHHHQPFATHNTQFQPSEEEEEAHLNQSTALKQEPTTAVTAEADDDYVEVVVRFFGNRFSKLTM